MTVPATPTLGRPISGKLISALFLLPENARRREDVPIKKRHRPPPATRVPACEDHLRAAFRDPGAA